MKPATFLSKLEHQRISEAIAAAERSTSGEIRVFVSRAETADPRAAAEEQFMRLGMVNTRERNGVLLYFAPASRAFAVIGDQGIHQKCGDELWGRVIAKMSERLKQEQFTDGIIEGIREVGTVLARHFPSTDGGPNELPNEVVQD